MAKIVNKNNYKFMSKKLMLEKTNTASKNTLNLKMTVDPNNKNKVPIAAFIYYNFEDLFLDETKHSELIELNNQYSKGIKEKGSEYYVYNQYLIEILNKPEQEVKQKQNIIDEFNKIISTKKIPLKTIFEEAEIKYANAYNFFSKGQTTKITLEKAKEILSIAKSK